MKASGPARPRRRGFGTGQKWSFLPEGRLPALPRGERRRGRAVDVQGPHARRARSAPAHRGHRHLRVRDRVQPRVHLPARRVRARLRAARRRPSPTRTSQGLPRQEHPRLGLRPRDRRAPRRRRVHLRRGDRRCSRASRASAAMPRIKPPFPAIAGPLREADRREQRRDAVDASRTSCAMGGEEYAKLGVGPVHRHAHLLGLGSRRAARQLRGRARHARSATSSTASPAASAAASR